LAAVGSSTILGVENVELRELVVLETPALTKDGLVVELLDVLALIVDV
jgi:hypothetical protein